jgi:hypothetical protein
MGCEFLCELEEGVEGGGGGRRACLRCMERRETVSEMHGESGGRRVGDTARDAVRSRRRTQDFQGPKKSSSILLSSAHVFFLDLINCDSVVKRRPLKH